MIYTNLKLIKMIQVLLKTRVMIMNYRKKIYKLENYKQKFKKEIKQSINYSSK